MNNYLPFPLSWSSILITFYVYNRLLICDMNKANPQQLLVGINFYIESYLFSINKKTVVLNYFTSDLK